MRCSGQQTHFNHDGLLRSRRLGNLRRDPSRDGTRRAAPGHSLGLRQMLIRRTPKSPYIHIRLWRRTKNLVQVDRKSRDLQARLDLLQESIASANIVLQDKCSMQALKYYESRREVSS